MFLINVNKIRVESDFCMPLTDKNYFVSFEFSFSVCSLPFENRIYVKIENHKFQQKKKNSYFLINMLDTHAFFILSK